MSEWGEGDDFETIQVNFDDDTLELLDRVAALSKCSRDQVISVLLALEIEKSKDAEVQFSGDEND